MNKSYKSLIRRFIEFDKVIKKDYKKQLALASWEGYPKEFNS